MRSKKDQSKDTVEILIVEDSATQAEQLRYLLEQRHYKVIVADDGKKALALLGEHKPSMVISDIIMPEMNGYELCRRIKSDNGNLDIPVILLTSLSNSEDVLEGLACGADNFITKPYSEDYLLLHIEQILANKKLHKNERVRIGVEIMFAGKKRFIRADQQQMLSLLISTYEAAVRKNLELVQTQNELRSLNERLEDIVEKRTAALSAEVTERKQAEEALRGSEERWRSLVQNAPNIILTLDRDQKITFINYVLPGFDINQVIGQSIYKFVLPESVDVMRRAFERVFVSGESETYEIMGYGIEGKPSWYSSRVGAIKQDGEIVSLLIISSDITERKRAEEGLKRQMEELERFNKLAVGRELKMIELKERIQALEAVKGG